MRAESGGAETFPVQLGIFTDCPRLDFVQRGEAQVEIGGYAGGEVELKVNS